jgi:hypothetical protein
MIISVWQKRVNGDFINNKMMMLQEQPHEIAKYFSVSKSNKRSVRFFVGKKRIVGIKHLAKS